MLAMVWPHGIGVNPVLKVEGRVDGVKKHAPMIFCTRPPYCTGKPINVTISNECPGKCNEVPFHFDLSGFAFGAMANPGQEHNLRQLGQVDIQYK
ncbi:expansin-B15-like protein, partial [Tanacetum coccineum]